VTRWSQASPYGNVTVVVTDVGLRELSLPGDDPRDDPRDDPLGAADRHIARQLDEWFAARRRAFDVALDLHGIDGFRRAVLETLVREVPWGETVSYGELAALAGSPRAARAVGSAMRHNPIPFVIPCHRVIAAGHKIGGYGGGGRDAIALKRELLAREGVPTPR
jgi:methylated-DNA-[protein]-cysteine S-methyltransferase